MVQEKAKSLGLESQFPAIDRLPLNGLGRLGLLAFVCVAVPALYWPSASGLAAVWTDTARAIYLEGFPVAAIASWLLARRWRELAAQPLRPDVRALPFLLPLTLSWLVARRAGIEVAYEALLPPLLWFAVLALLGRRVARLCAFPMAFLYFAIPFWEAATGPLVFLTAHVSAHVAGLVGVPAQVAGRLVRIPAGAFEVADGCSGLHYLIVGLTIGALSGELNEQDAPRRALLLAVAGALSLVANWIRVTVIVITGQWTALHASFLRPGPYHYLFGWALLAVILVAYAFLAERLSSPPRLPTARVPQSPSIPDAPPGRAAVVAAWSCALLLLALGPAWAACDAWLAPAKVPAKVLWAAQGGWEGPAAGFGWRPRFPGADSEALATYTRRGTAIEVYAAVYASQGRGKKFTGYDTSALGSDVQVQSAESILAAGSPVLERVITDDRGGRWLLWQWYQVGGRTFAFGWRAQLWYGLDAIVTIPRSRTVILRAQCAATCAQTRTRLREFVRDNAWLRFN